MACRNPVGLIIFIIELPTIPIVPLGKLALFSFPFYLLRDFVFVRLFHVPHLQDQRISCYFAKRIGCFCEHLVTV